MPTFDADKALDQIEGDTEGLSILLSTFNRISPNQIEELRVAIDEENGEKLAALAHRFKGSLGLFAAEPAAKITRHLENDAVAADFKNARETLAELESECEQLKTDLATFLRSTE